MKELSCVYWVCILKMKHRNPVVCLLAASSYWAALSWEGQKQERQTCINGFLMTLRDLRGAGDLWVAWLLLAVIRNWMYNFLWVLSVLLCNILQGCLEVGNTHSSSWAELHLVKLRTKVLLILKTFTLTFMYNVQHEYWVLMCVLTSLWCQ